MRKTKEQILKEQKSTGDWDYCLRAIDQYAKEEAIEFAEWSGRRYAKLYDTNSWRDMNDPFDNKFTTEEIYKIFIFEKDNKL